MKKLLAASLGALIAVRAGMAAAIGVSPASYDFGGIVTGQTAQTAFVITNSGETVLTGSVSITNGLPFEVVGDTNFTLAAGTSTNISISFSPVVAGNFNDSIIFQSDVGTTNAALTGTGVLPPQLLVSPGAYNYGIVIVGQSAQTTFVITNSGGVALAGSLSITNGLSFAVAGGTNFIIAAGASSNITVSFSPVVAGSFNDAIRLQSNGGTVNVDLAGTGVLPPQLLVSPLVCDFGSVLTGQMSQTAFVITNSGGVALTGSISITNGLPFAVVGGTNFLIAAGASSNITVSFSPVVAGSFNNAIHLQSNGGAVNVGLSGTGILPAQLLVSPASYDFGGIATGQTAQTAFVITNSGGVALTGSISITNGLPFALTGGTNFIIAAGTSSNITVRFSPDVIGSFNDAIHFQSNSGVTNAELTGSGVLPPRLGMSPSSYDFGGILTGQTAQTAFVITNSGGAVLIGSVSTTNGIPFAVAGSTNFIIAAGSSSNITVNFSPVVAGNFSDVLIFQGNGGTTNAALVGTGVLPPQLGVSPIFCDFGNVITGQIVQTMFVVTNFGGLPLIGSIAITNGLPFAVVGGTNFTLVPGTSTNITASFSPEVIGTFNDAIHFQSNGGVTDAELVGNGVLPPPPQLGVSPVFYDFGNVLIGQSAQTTFYITNSGGSVLTGSVAIAGGPPFAVAGDANFIIDPGTFSNIVFSFTPTSPGSVTDTVTFASNGGVTNVALTGTGCVLSAGYDLWASAITNGLTDGTQSATGDGYPNLLKYATGSSPTQPDSLAAMCGTFTNGQFTFSFNRNTNATDVTLYVEDSPAAVNDAPWTAITTNIGGAGWSPADGVTETGAGTPVRVRVIDPAPGSNRFMRLRVTR